MTNPTTEMIDIHTEFTNSINNELAVFQDKTRKQTLLDLATTLEKVNMGGSLDLAIKLTRSEANKINIA